MKRRLAISLAWIVRCAVFVAEASLAADEARSGTPSSDDDVRALRSEVETRPANAALAARVATRLDEVQTSPAAASSAIREQLDALHLVPLRVPGLFYRTHPRTGADLARVERVLGRPVTRVDTGEIDPVERNAEIVGEAIRAAVSKPGQRVLLFSVSKGSADVQEALARDPTLGARVAVWIDLVGLLEGTPLTDPGFAPSELAALGLPEATARSMSRQARAASAKLPLPETIAAVRVAGFPTSAAISERARAGFALLSPLGPSDGFVLLATFLRAPGRVLVLRDADHYLQVPDLDARLTALVTVVLDEVREKR